jgi:CheY-like chemotaxis protein
VDDSQPFLEAASKLLELQGLAIVATASTSAEALVRVREHEPEVTIVDVNLKGESGFDLAWELAANTEGRTSTILTSTRGEADFAELVALTPVLGFIPKNELSAGAVHDVVADRSHGHGCRHEALIYSSGEELATATLPFIRQGLLHGDHLLVVLREEGRSVLQQALGEEAARIEFADSIPWYQSPEHAYAQYTRYLDDHLGRGAPRVRVVAEVIWPQASAAADIAGWKRYEAGISGALAPVPVSFICTYDTRELPAGIIRAAERTHPVLRTVGGPRPSGHYSPAGAFLRDLEREESELLSSHLCLDCAGDA